ncbi:MAG: hypothetical protein ACE14Q_01185 [Acidobacteriota bacterium]
MKQKLLLVLMIAVSLVSLASSYFPQFYHLYNPVVGEWSKYEMKDNQGNKAILTISVVSKEGSNYWIEVESSQMTDVGIAGYLVSGDPTEDSNVLKVRLKSGDGPIIEITKETLEKMKNAQKSASVSTGIGPTIGKIQSLPNETLKVGSETYDCQRIKLISSDDRFADIWINEKVSPFGIVKLISGDESLILIDAGKGAKPRLLGNATPLVLD